MPATAQDYAIPADLPGAERAARAALARTPQQPGIEHARQLLLLGRALDLQLRSAEAEPILREATTMLAALPAPPPDLVRVADFYLADTLIRLDRHADALPLARRALTALPPGDSLDRAYSKVQLARILIALEQWNEAESIAQDAYRIRSARLGHRNTLTQNALAYLARIHGARGDAAKAERLFRSIVEFRTAIGDKAQTFDATVEYADFLSTQDRPTEAVPIYRAALALAKQVFADDKDIVAWRQFELAKALWRSRAPAGDAEAERLIRDGLSQIDKGDMASARDLGEPLYILGSLLSDNGRAAEAEQLFRRAIAAEEAAGETKTLWYGNMLGALAHALMLQSGGGTTAENPRHPEARKLLERQIAVIEGVNGPTSPDLALPLQRLSIVLRWQRDPAANAIAQRALGVVPDTQGETRVRALYQSADTLDAADAIVRIKAARAMLVAISGERDAFLFNIDERLAQLTQAVGDLDQTEMIRRAILARRIAAGDGKATARDQAILAILLVNRGKLDLAHDMATDALRRLTDLGEGDSIEAGYAIGTLGAIAYRRGDLAEAEARTRAELAIYDARIPGGYARMIAATLTSLGNILIARGRAGEAVPLLDRAAAIHSRWFGPESGDVGYAGIVRARALASAGRVTEAKLAFERSYGILARITAKTPDSPQLIAPTVDYARFVLTQLSNPARARSLLRATQPLIIQRAARAGIDRDAALELAANRGALTLAVRANWVLAANK